MNATTRSLLRLALLALVFLLAGLVWRHPFVPQVMPGRIIGGSMAPTLAGTWHYILVCADCGFNFPCDADAPPDRDLAVCPNCGYSENETQSLEPRQGARVDIDLAAFTYRPPQRWEIVALLAADEEHPYTVKRIVGLPGERIDLHKGDLYVDGRLHRKSLADLKRLAVTVHDDRFRPTKRQVTGRLTPPARQPTSPARQPDESDSLPARWQGETADTRWRTIAEGYECDASASSEPDWLTYRHWSCMTNFLPRTCESPVLDNDSYNQSASQNVRDLLLTCRIEAQGAGSLFLRMHDGHQWFEVLLSPGRNEALLRRGGDELARSRLLPGVFGRGAGLELALCDQQVLVTIDGEPVFCCPYAASAMPLRPTTRPISIGAVGLAARVTDLRVLRDVHYLEPLGAGRPWSLERRLASEEFFALGDNAPISLDSRFWKPGSVTRKSLIGRVLAAP